MRVKLIAGFFLLGLTFGCCRYEKCKGAEYITEIQFYNFSMQELDLITIGKYAKGNHSSAQQTYNFANLQSDEGQYFQLEISPSVIQDAGSDYKLFIAETQQEFWITDLDYVEVKCGGGTCKQTFNTLESFKVDGVKQTLAVDSAVVITKP